MKTVESWINSRLGEVLLMVLLSFAILFKLLKKCRKRRSNLELYQSYKEYAIVNFIKIQRIKWVGHVVRMNEDHTTKKVFNAQPTGTQRKGRVNLRWVDDLEKDLLVLRTRNWRTLAGRRLAWKRLLEKAKAHPGLSSH
ncbi:uncharacterized protein TNCV_1146331 [Trichonephila clavipes]|nr:uncharacterized protein TNCV_1146331 [Trichonephila clavipes]